MHPAAHAFTKLDPTPVPGEEHIRKLFKECPDCDSAGALQLREAGLGWGAILSLMLKYGPAFKEIIQVILAALNANPPEPLNVEQKKAKAPRVPREEEEDEEKVPPHSGQREDKATRDTTPSSPPTLTAKDLTPKKPEVKGEPPSKAK